MNEVPGDSGCVHSWVLSTEVILTNPPMSHRICDKCGRIEHVYSSHRLLRDPFVDTWNKFYKSAALKEKP